jgi:hypothetical protein
LVAVRVYTPGVFVNEMASGELNPFGLVQKYWASGLEDDPISITVAISQVKRPDTSASTSDGGIVSLSTVTESLAVHPLTFNATVKKYFPALFTNGICKLDVNPLGPVQLYDTPVDEVVPVRNMEPMSHVRLPEAVAVTFAGGVIFCVTSTDLSTVHSLSG